LCRDQYDCAYQRDHQSAKAHVSLVDRCCAEYAAKQPAAERGTDDAYEHVEEYSLPAIRAHNHTRNPADQSANN
jgi:F0F1-type ATP synthase gamma subunit